jgi:hypothetical protein
MDFMQPSYRVAGNWKAKKLLKLAGIVWQAEGARSPVQNMGGQQ